ncbi:hypothetical protein L0244_08475 [bacterium]|nr:hypothetical protein [bacterium]
MIAVVDNDIVFKGSCYQLLDDIIPEVHTERVGVLGATRYVVSKKIRKAHLSGNVQSAIECFENFIKKASELEPTIAEQNLAAELEFTAQKLGLSFDTGESQLSAIVITRQIPLLLTGDKRAIRSLEQMIESLQILSDLCGKIKCLEQLFVAAVQRGDIQTFRSSICAESNLDKTLTICFGCSSIEVTL